MPPIPRVNFEETNFANVYNLAHLNRIFFLDVSKTTFWLGKKNDLFQAISVQ
jgi:hypothetical protein